MKLMSAFSKEESSESLKEFVELLSQYSNFLNLKHVNQAAGDSDL